MPINTVYCPHCRARVNHIVSLSPKREMRYANKLTCPRCKKEFEIQQGFISERTVEAAQELKEFTESMDSMSSEFEKFVANVGEKDTVEEALDKADAVFRDARNALDEIALDVVDETINADKLLEMYSVPDVKQFTLGKAQRAVDRAQERYGIPDELSDAAMTAAEAVYDAAASRLQGRNKVSDNIPNPASM